VTVAIWLLFLVPLGVALAAKSLLRMVFRRYRAVPNHRGVTGAEVARALLDAHGLQDVRLELAPGS
jgi:Zn-dependent membrane protease YugP